MGDKMSNAGAALNPKKWSKATGWTGGETGSGSGGGGGGGGGGLPKMLDPLGITKMLPRPPGMGGGGK